MRKRKHRLLSLFMVFSLVLALLPLSTITVLAAWDGSVEISDWYGDGTAMDYIIDTSAQLAGLAVIVNGTATDVDGFTGQDSFQGKTVTLNADLNLMGQDWIPIGTANNKFQGTFDGGNKSISNLSIGNVETPDDTLRFLGLFGIADSTSEIKNVSLDSVSIYSSLGTNDNFAYIGALAGHSTGSINNCQSSGVLQGGYKSTVGGLVGMSGDFYGNGSITDCTSSCTVTSGDGASNAGGLIGYVDGIQVSNSSASGAAACGAVTGNTGSPMAGGLIGSISTGTVTDSSATGDVTGGDGSLVGGFCGYNDGSISGSTATGDVQAGDNAMAGGFIGANITSEKSIKDCTAAGDVSIGDAVSDRAYAGGFVGKNSGGDMSGCTAQGAVTGGEARAEAGSEIDAILYVGGFGGYISTFWLYDNTVKQCFSYGNVTARDALFSDSSDSTSNLYAGGFVGYSDGACIQQCAAVNVETSADSLLISGSGNTGGVYVGGFGGLVFGSQRPGYVREGIVINCYARGGKVSGNTGANLGGFAGGCIAQDDQYDYQYDAFALILNCYSTVDTSYGNSANVGGFVGYLENANIVNSYATGGHAASSYATGGPAASSYVTGATPSASVGGFVGNVAAYDKDDLLSDTYYDSGNYSGGAVGSNGSIKTVLTQGLSGELMRGTIAGSIAYNDGNQAKEASALLNALNGGNGLVKDSMGSYYLDILTWEEDSESVNDGYPIFGGVWTPPETPEANSDDNTVSVSPSTAPHGTAVVITAEGSCQNDEPAAGGSTRYVPVSWSSNEAGNPGGAFTQSGETYTASYTPASAGTYTITAMFRLQGWIDGVWMDAPDEVPDATDTKTTTLTVTASGGGDSGGGGNGNSTGSTTPAETSQTDLGGVTTKNGTATATVDSTKLAEKISESKPGDTIVFAITGNVSGADFNLTVADLKTVADNGSMLQLESTLGIYKLPATEIDFDSISKQYPGIKYKDIRVTVSFSYADGTHAILKGSTLVGKPVSISVSLTAGEKAIELDEFTKYVERDMPVPDGSEFTAGVVIEKDGALRPVPTKKVTINGKTYAAIFSRTNSVYALAVKPVSFDDMKGHWAKEEANDMASRLMITGVGNNDFAPDRDITRAEFAVIIVRALGLRAQNSHAFTDVKTDSWYSGAAAAAYKYGILSGYDDGTFKPNIKITRQQAMVMIARAMKVVRLDTTITDEAAAAELAKFIDGDSFSIWARTPAAAVIRSGLVAGSNGYARAQENITRAETAVIVRSLLEKAGLV